jgi:hypothetical protein
LLLIASLVDWGDKVSFRKNKSEDQHDFAWFVLHKNKPKLPIFFVFTHCDQAQPVPERLKAFTQDLIRMTGLDKIFSFESKSFITTCGQPCE